ASNLGQAAHRRRTCQSQWLGAARQPQHRQTHPPRRLSLAFPSDSGEKGGFAPVTRTAEEPGQTVNVDLWFVPATHTPTDAKLPSASGSSGRLLVERPRDARSESAYPGQIFAAEHPSYAEAMQAFVAASSATPAPAPEAAATPGDALSAKAAQHALRQE